MATTSISSIDGITASRASWVPMIVVATAQVLVVFNIAAVKVSIDGIATSLAAPANTVKAAMVAYLLVIAALIMLGARVRQRFGARRVFRVMLALYMAAMTVMTFSRGAAGMLAAQLAAGTASVHRDLEKNPLVPDELKRELNLDRGVSFVSNDRLQAVLARTTATPGQVAEAVRINTEARLRALKISLFFLAGLALLASVRAAGVQDTPGPGAAADESRRAAP